MYFYSLLLTSFVCLTKQERKKMGVCDCKLFLPHHECFVHRVPQLEGVVTDGQVVFQSERLQHNAVSHWESQTQVITGVTLNGKQSWLLGRFHRGNFMELHLHFDQSIRNYICFLYDSQRAVL